MTFDLQTFDFKTIFIEKVVQKITNLANQKIDNNKPFRLLLSGGTTPRDIYQELRNIDTDWSKWRFYYGDERYLPPRHPDLNSTMVEESLLNHIPILLENHKKIDTSLSLEEAAENYRKVVDSVELFDLTLLGIGEDGHTASLFPGNELGEKPNSPSVLIVKNSPKPPVERITLSLDRINRSENILILASGSGKKNIINEIISTSHYPASLIKATQHTEIFHLSEP